MRNPLMQAAKHQDLSALNEAIRLGADLNCTDSQGWTPLSHATHRRWVEGMKRLIEAGADVNPGKKTGSTALLSAVLNGHLEGVQLLLDAGAKVWDVQGVRLTGYAQGKKREQIVAALERATQHS